MGRTLFWLTLQKVPGKQEAQRVVGTSQQLTLPGNLGKNPNFPEARTPSFLGSPIPLCSLAPTHLSVPAAGSKLEGADGRSMSLGTWILSLFGSAQVGFPLIHLRLPAAPCPPLHLALGKPCDLELLSASRVSSSPSQGPVKREALGMALLTAGCGPLTAQDYLCF